MSKSSSRVLIITTITGGGHVAIANALDQYLTTLPHPPLIKIFNTAPEISSKTYRLTGEYFVDFHGQHWQSTNNPKNAKLLHSLSTPFLASKISKAIKAFQPHLLISTHPFANEETAQALKNLKLNLPLIVVIADPFTIHHAWTTYKLADKYLAPTPEAVKILSQRQIDPQKIALTGLPLRLSVFKPSLTQLQAQKNLKLPSQKTTIFIGGSGEGHGQIYKTTRQLCLHPDIQSQAQLLVVAGKNKRAFSKLKSLAKKYPFLKPFGYTSLIDTLLIASDFVVGKPGPNILFETLTLKKPFITTHPPLSQERGNYQYIKKNHLGLITYKPSSTVRQIIKIVRQPQLLDQFQPGIKKHFSFYQSTPPKTLAALKPYL